MNYHEIFEIDCSEYTYLSKKVKSKFPPSLNARLHWAVRGKSNVLWRHRTLIAIGRKKPKLPLHKSMIVFTWHSSSARDFTNMVTAIKPIEDALVGVVIVDDSMEYIKTDFKFEKVKRGCEKITIEVTEVNSFE